MHSSRMRTVDCSGRRGGAAAGVSAQMGGVCPGRPPWTEFLTHACENITFPQLLLRTVKISLMFHGNRNYSEPIRLFLSE